MVYFKADGNSPKHHAQCRHAISLIQCMSRLRNDILGNHRPLKQTTHCDIKRLGDLKMTSPVFSGLIFVCIVISKAIIFFQLGGGSGFIGRNICSALRKSGYKTVIVTRDAKRKQDAVTWVSIENS